MGRFKSALVLTLVFIFVPATFAMEAMSDKDKVKEELLNQPAKILIPNILEFRYVKSGYLHAFEVKYTDENISYPVDQLLVEKVCGSEYSHINLSGPTSAGHQWLLFSCEKNPPQRIRDFAKEPRAQDVTLDYCVEKNTKVDRIDEVCERVNSLQFN